MLFGVATCVSQAPPKSKIIQSMRSDLRAALLVGFLDGRNRAIVIAESLARVIAAIRITSVCWQIAADFSPPKTQKLFLRDPAFVALRLESCDWRSCV